MSYAHWRRQLVFHDPSLPTCLGWQILIHLTQDVSFVRPGNHTIILRLLAEDWRTTEGNHEVIAHWRQAMTPFEQKWQLSHTPHHFSSFTDQRNFIFTDDNRNRIIESGHGSSPQDPKHTQIRLAQ
jgi:hypothetical protein